MIIRVLPCWPYAYFGHHSVHIFGEINCPVIIVSTCLTRSGCSMHSATCFLCARPGGGCRPTRGHSREGWVTACDEIKVTGQQDAEMESFLWRAVVWNYILCCTCPMTSDSLTKVYITSSSNKPKLFLANMNVLIFSSQCFSLCDQVIQK